MNLIRPTYLIVVLTWIMIFYRCSTLHVKLPIYHLKSIQGTEQKNTIKRLEENRIRAILWEKQSTSHIQTQGIDGLLLQHYNKLVLIDWALQKPSYIQIVTKPNHAMLYGLTRTVGNTLVDVK